MVEMRDMVLSDVPCMIGMLEEHAHLLNRPYDRVYTEMMLNDAVHSDHFFTRVMLVDGEVCGGFIGMLVDNLYSPHRIALDIGAMSVGDAQKVGAHGLALFKQFEEWAREHGAIQIVISLSNDAPVQRLGTILKRLHYTHAGVWMIKELNDG